MRRLNLCTFALIALNFVCLSVAASDKPAALKAEDIVAKHLDSVGTAQARTATKARVIQGSAQYQVLVGGAGTLEGKGILVSQEHKLQLMMKFPNNQYRGEQFIYDGSHSQISFSTPTQHRSPLGEFVRVQDVLLREGLLGGVLSTAWPLNDLAERKAKLEYQGIKTIDGHPLHDVRYRPKKSSDLEIHLYFDPETFHHVLTVYTLSIRAGISSVDAQLSNATSIAADEQMRVSPSPTGGVVTESSETATARQQETRYRIEERFSDFIAADGLTLPTHYKIHFTQELHNGATSVTDWTIVASQIENVPSVDPRNFEVK